jgi:hypothetical protein
MYKLKEIVKSKVDAIALCFVLSLFAKMDIKSVLA